MEPDETRTLGMQVERRGASVLITWDRRGRAVLESNGGTLQIDERGRSRFINLGPEEIRAGQLLYTPGSGNLRMELAIHSQGGDVSQSVLVIGNEGQFAEVQMPPLEIPNSASTSWNPRPSVSNAPPPAQPEPSPEKQPSAPRVFTPPPRAAAPPSSVSRTSGIPEPPLLIPENRVGSRLPDIRAELPDRPTEKGAVLKGPAYVAARVIQSVQPSSRDGFAIGNIALQQSGTAQQVDVEVTIDATGKVTKARPAHVTGVAAPLLVPGAIAAAARWTFNPAIMNGRPVESTMILSFKYAQAAR